MGKLEPDNSPDLTHAKSDVPFEPERTSPREDAARAKAKRREEEERKDDGEG